MNHIFGPTRFFFYIVIIFMTKKSLNTAIQNQDIFHTHLKLECLLKVLFVIFYENTIEVNVSFWKSERVLH